MSTLYINLLICGHEEFAVILSFFFFFLEPFKSQVAFGSFYCYSGARLFTKFKYSHLQVIP